MDGWIKLHRKTLENPVFQNDDTAWKVFTVLLLTVDREGTRTLGRSQFAAVCGMNPSTFWKALLRLEKCQMVNRSSNSLYTTVSICNWKEYQTDGNSFGNNEVTAKYQPSNSQVTLNKNKNKNKEVHTSPTPSRLLDQWALTVGTTLRSNLALQEKAAQGILESVGPGRFQELLQAVRLIRADKYQPRSLQIGLVNYSGLARNLEQVEAYIASTMDGKAFNSQSVRI